ncbi:MAG: MFS transporter [Rickettsia sp.]|nr:MFS transporter [Rickettsia sp.]
MKKIFTYSNYILNKIFLLSVISGFPLGIIYSSIFVWLQDYQIDIVVITSFLIVRIPYSLKFIWGNMIEYLSSSYIKKIGAKKSWMFLSIIFMSIILLMLSYSNPQKDLKLIYFLSFLFSVISSIYDTSFESFRLEFIKSFNMNSSKIITNSSFGHKIGILTSSITTLLIAEKLGWSKAFFINSIVYLSSALYLINIKDNKYSFYPNFSLYLKKIALAYREFSSRNNWKLTIFSVILLKIGKTMLSSTILLYYASLGFSKTKLAFMSYFYDFIVFCLGVFISYFFVKKLRYQKALILCFTLQLITYPLFIILGWFKSFYILAIVTTVDGLITGMTINIYTIYLNELVNKKFIAIQYSFLVSLSNMINNIVALTISGLMIKILNWDRFFIFIMLLSIPGLIIFIMSQKKNKKTISHEKKIIKSKQ